MHLCQPLQGSLNSLEEYGLTTLSICILEALASRRQCDIRHQELRFSAIIMNPPFEKGQEIDHVLRAHRLLAPNGVLAAIISEGAFHRTDKKASAFRQFLASTNAVDAKLPSASFKPSGTAVACRMIRIKAGR